MATKPAFDPGQPFDVDNTPPIGKPAFDPNQAFSPASPPAQAESKPAFDPSQSWSVPQVISQAGDAASDLWSRASNLVTGQSSATPAQPGAVDLPMPGPIDSLTAGIRRSAAESGQSLETIQGKQPTQLPEQQGPETKPWELRDLYEPSRGLSKLAYGIGQSSPTLAAGIAGGAGGSLAGPVGTAIGGAGGAALGAAFQAIGPRFASELKRNPQDPDGAWERTLQGAATSGLFSGASWGLFPVKFFQGPLKNLAFQAFGIQPGLNVAEQATQNVIEGDDVTKGLKDAYTSGAVTTAVPALGHLALRGRFGEPQTKTTEPTAADIAADVNKYQNLSQQYAAQASQAGITPTMADKYNKISSQYGEIAKTMADRQAAQQRVPAKLAQAEQLEKQAEALGTGDLKYYDLRAQAADLRGEARQDAFIGSIPQTLPEPSKGIWGRAKESYLTNIDPASRSESALRADAVFADFKSKKMQIENAIVHRGTETYRKLWDNVPIDDQLRWYKNAEMGLSPPNDLLAKYPWMDQARKDYRQQLELAYKNESQVGSRAGYVEDYLPHMYKDPAKAREAFQSMAQSLGPTWFQKDRHYDLLEMGLDAGLELKHDNIQDMINARLISGGDMVNKMELLHELQLLGVGTPLEKAPPHVVNPSLIDSPFRWNQIKAPNGEHWLLAPDVQDLWKNGVEAKGLWDNEGFTGDAFRSWMKVKSGWVPVKLALSAFHPVHVAHIDFVNAMSGALRETFGRGQQSLGSRITAVPRAIGQVARDFANMPEEMLRAVSLNYFNTPPSFEHAGQTMRKAWLTPKENWTPQQAADVRLMNEAGISAQMPEQYRINAQKAFRDAWKNNKYLSVLGQGGLRTIEKMQHWLFEEWIPNLKMAALKREADTLFRRRPDLITDTANRRVALRALGKQIDNRFGEMTYGSLFWNRTLKDASIGSFLSLGWNLGFAREFGGGFFEPIVRRMIDAPNPTRKLVRDTTNKTTNMLLYGVTAMAINAAMQKAFTGDNPEGLDYIFPRIGGLNPDGSPRRITNAFYTREVPMAMKNIEEQQSVVGGLTQMLYHKMLFQPFVEMGQNKDYFGNQIYDENSPFFQRAWQFGQHLVSDQLNPMSIAGAKRALQLSGKPYTTTDVLKQLTDRDVVMPFLGFGPAPAYASRSPLENRIMYLFKRYVAPEAKSFETGAKSVEKSEARTEYLGAIQRGDKQKQLEAAKKLASLGVQTSDIRKLQPGGSTQYMFQRLPAPDQKALLKTMSGAEFKEFFPKTQKKLRGDPEVLALAKHFYSAPQ